MAGSVLRDRLAAGDLAGCAAEARARLQRDPRDAEALFALAMASAEAGRVGDALRLIEPARRLDPANAEYAAQTARLLILARQDAAAAEAAQAAAQLPTGDARVLDTIGCVFARLGDHGAALPLFARAVDLAPDDTDYRFNFATSLGFFGRTHEAAVQYEAVIAREPHSGRAHLGLAGLRRHTRDDHHVVRIEAALGVVRDPDERLQLHHAAAKELEDIGEPARSFAHLKTANSAHKTRLGYRPEQDEALFAAIRHAFSGPLPQPSDLPDAPVFVVGLPRTGTTLVERILAAHPGLTAAGELQAMPLAVKEAAATRSRHVLDPETVAAAAAFDPGALGRAYLARARQNAGARGGRFIDKFPLNFLYVGWIAMALPNARIVCLRRGAMDAVLSTYKHLFAAHSSYYAWSYDPLDCARYLAQQRALVTFWQERFPGRVLDFSYEGLVADQEGQTRRLLDHCGLEWDEACLNFHAQQGAVATPSAQQVRRPLNADAIGRWHTHADALADAAAFLQAQGIALD
ncbi:sulfotransferase [Novosphingobium sp. FKTRR1]|uniref:tetratricopeptide repeat-containing sulfotransferase family protein n=1 Tax=Novosphingobium sp. FKTRR1 TaxID=2879118 RepID=UPI001CEFEEB7|nr:sulfotransferase [Novosphingobium sp. FKTRR1]